MTSPIKIPPGHAVLLNHSLLARPIPPFIWRQLSRFGIEHPRVGQVLGRIRRMSFAYPLRRDQDRRIALWRRWLG